MEKNNYKNKFANEILDTIYNYLKNGVINSVKEKHFEAIRYLSLMTTNGEFSIIIIKNLGDYYREIRDESDAVYVDDLLNDLLIIKERIENSSFKSINSENYYTKKIKELKIKENELNELLKQKNNHTKEHKKITKNTLEKLNLIEQELEKKKRELEIRQKEDDAKSDWKEKIIETFNQLKEYLNPIEKEHKRLNALYYWFAILGILCLIGIIIIEFSAICKLNSVKDFPTYEDYLMTFIPLPIAGALMWGFIFQMNRAQRQLIVLANDIHSINYIQGLLIAINNLSPNVNDSILRINTALDKIISNHLDKKYLKSEIEIKEEENKDTNIKVEEIIKLIKATKDTVK